MLTPTEGHPMQALLLHLDSQRACALKLIENQNQVLASFLGRGNFPVPMAKAASVMTHDVYPATDTSVPNPVAQKKGNVVSLFEHAKPAADAGTKISTPAPSTHYLVFKECDMDAKHPYKNDIDTLLSAFGSDEALAFKRKQVGDTIFLSASRQGFFYHKSQPGMLFSPCYVGADEHFAASLRELQDYAAENGLQINLMAQEARVHILKENGFTTTPMGIWQSINPLSSFTLEGQAMRRLRYLVSKYQKMGRCHTTEYVPGTAPDVDKAICEVIDQWFELKGKIPPLFTDFKEKIMQGCLGKEHRVFLTYRDDAIDNVLVFSRDNLNDGYLMDLEFYGQGVPLGSTEFALIEIIEHFKKEGRRSISLGATLGTALFEHENGSKEVYAALLQLKNAGFQDGDGNAQYKNKYRPTTTPYYLARPNGCGKSKLNDLVYLLGS